MPFNPTEQDQSLAPWISSNEIFLLQSKCLDPMVGFNFKNSVNFTSLWRIGCQLWCCGVIFSHLLFILIFELKKLTEILTRLLQTRVTLIFNGGSSRLAHTRYRFWYSSSLVSKGRSLLSYDYTRKNRPESVFKHRWHLQIHTIFTSVWSFSFRSALLATHAISKEGIHRPTNKIRCLDIARRTQIIRIKANMTLDGQVSNENVPDLMFQSKDDLNSKSSSQHFQHQKESSIIELLEKVRDRDLSIRHSCQSFFSGGTGYIFLLFRWRQKPSNSGTILRRGFGVKSKGLLSHR